MIKGKIRRNKGNTEGLHKETVTHILSRNNYFLNVLSIYRTLRKPP